MRRARRRREKACGAGAREVDDTASRTPAQRSARPLTTSRTPAGGSIVRARGVNSAAERARGDRSRAAIEIQETHREDIMRITPRRAGAIAAFAAAVLAQP